ncbi:MAG: S-layer homology domain-containing protein [Bacillota bacterium]|jgi:endonuclease I
MKKHLRIFIAALLLTAAAGFAAPSPSLAAVNSGVRHQVCGALSDRAKAYYGDGYDWAVLSAEAGAATDSSLTAMTGPLYLDLRRLMTETMTASVTYRNLTTYWQTTDASANGGELLFYSDDLAAKASGYINREHVWAKSHASFYQLFGGADLHHLRPEDGPVNSARSNYTFGDVVGVMDSYKTKAFAGSGETVLWYGGDKTRVEVKDDVKGDVARILLYVYVRWGQPNLCVDAPLASLPAFDSDDTANDGVRVIADVDTLLAWCAEDPVDTWEMSRNDCVQDVQGNRNVFIDYPEYAWLLFGRELPAAMATPSGEAAAAAVVPDLPFNDVPRTAYFYDAVAWAVERGITAGKTADTFAPGDTCTRGQMAAFLWRSAGSPAPVSSERPFSDVKAGAYYADAVAWAVENGITYGTAAETFSPDDTVTRAQAVAFLARTAKASPSAEENPFADVVPGAYYYDAVRWAAETGITAGTTATTFSPEKPCLRGQIVTFLYRFGEMTAAERASR